MIVMMQLRGKHVLRQLTTEHLSKMTMAQLVEYETRVWNLAEKTKFPLRAVDVLNAIYREVEWRSQEKHFAPHPRS